LGNPASEDWNDFVTPPGVNSALSTFGKSHIGLQCRRLFDDHINQVYATYGHNSLIKEIRLFANLKAMDEYHSRRELPWYCVGIIESKFL
jgi:hypothetical protein